MPGARGWVVCCAVLLLVGCAHVDLEADRKAILATDRPWQEAIAAKDVMENLSGDAIYTIVEGKGVTATVKLAAPGKNHATQ